MVRNKNCECSEMIVDYLYDELESSSFESFENHLEKCAVCSDELAAFSAVRGGISEWREIYFDSIDLPLMDRSVFSAAATEQKTVAETGILDRLRTFLNGIPAWSAVPVMGLLLIGIGMFFFTTVFRSPGTLAVNAPAATEVSPIEINLPDSSAPETKDDVAKTASETGKISSGPDKAEKADVRSVKVRSQEPKRSERNRENVKTPVNLKDDIPVQAVKEIPKLTNFTEIEDDSIRLSDLFEEVGSK